MTAQPPPAAPPASTGTSVTKIVGLVILAVVVLCGLLGTCLFLVSLALPLISQQ